MAYKATPLPFNTLDQYGYSPYYPTRAARPPAQPQQQPAAQPQGPLVAGAVAAPTTTAAQTRNVPGVLSSPGIGEQWWKQNQGRFTAPTNLQGYWQGVQGRTAGQGMQPSNSTKAWGNIQGYYTEPTAGTANAWSSAAQMRNPTSGENTMRDASSYFRQPSRVGGYVNSIGYKDFVQPGATEGYFNTAMPQLAHRGEGTSAAIGTLGRLSGPGAAEANNASVIGLVGGAKNTEGYNQRLQNSGFVDRNYVGDELSYFRPELRENSYSEDLYESGNQGLNTFYDREFDKRSRRLKDQMAASGVFGSGATARSLFELEGELGASQARDMAELAAQADQAKIARAGAAESFAGSAGNEELSRYGLGLESASAADESIRSNAATLTDAASAAQDAELRRIFGAADIGLKADAQDLDRILGGGTLANQADTQRMNRLKTGADLQEMSDRFNLDQGEALASVGDRMAGREATRMRDSADIGLRADSEQRARMNDYFGNARNLDADTLESERFNREGAAALDAQEWQRLTGGLDAASGVQQLFQDRERLGFKDNLSLAQSMSGLVQQASGASAEEQARLKAQIVQGLIAEGGLDSSAAEQQAEEMFKAAGILIKAKGK